MAAGGGLGRASALMASGSMVSRVLGIVRNALLVACVGSMGGTSDAFQTANTLPNTIFILLSGGVLSAVLIPEITRAMAREDGGQDIIDRLLTAAFGLVTIVAVAATLLAAPLITLFQLQGPARDLGIFFAYLCLPQIFFYGVSAILGQVLNAHDRFAAVMWTPVLANVVQIAGMGIFLSQYLGAQPPERWTSPMIWLLAGTATLGVAVQAVALIPALRGTGFRFTPRWGWRGYGFRRAFRVAVWTISALLIGQAGGVVVTMVANAVASAAREAGVVVAGYMVYTLAFQIFMVPHGIITTSILTALYPRMARSAHAGDVAGLRSDVTRALTVPALIMVPISAAAVALAAPGVKVLTPSLEPPGVTSLAWAFSLMAVGLFPYGVVALQQRYALARGDGRMNVRFQLVVTGVQLLSCGAALLVPPAWAVAVICAGQTLGNGLAALAFVAVAQRQVGGLPLRRLGVLLLRLVVVSVPAALLAWGAVAWVTGALPFAWTTSLLALTAGTAAFLVAFALGTRLIRIPELDATLPRRFRPAGVAGTADTHTPGSNSGTGDGV
ncbi:lipid II flippase MurJ [Propioniciclava soli]|uniref:Lipid II flippase MurJ n=1 Tax=Propioniciclava soli TaxID=2775081 RepID=A0ABZ3C786_9ACTN